jgi:hypothetical protein
MDAQSPTSHAELANAFLRIVAWCTSSQPGISHENNPQDGIENPLV